MKIAVCDDDKLELKKISDFIVEFKKIKQSTQELTVHTFSSGRELLIHLQKYGGFDLYILDIIMPELNGIELATKIRAHNDSCKIIFLTSSPEFAVDSYRVDAFYYLLKSSPDAELYAILQKALDEMSQDNALSIMVKEKKKWTRVPIYTIEYVESINHTVYFHLLRGAAVSCFNTLNAYEEALLSDERFIKCHKSYIVNMSHVSGITNKDFILDGGDVVPISRNLFQQVKDAYFDYFFKGYP